MNHCFSVPSGLPLPCWELSISDWADCISVLQLPQLSSDLFGLPGLPNTDWSLGFLEMVNHSLLAPFFPCH